MAKKQTMKLLLPAFGQCLQRAVEIEKGAKENLIELKGLGRNYAWGDLIKADKSQHKMFDDLEMFGMPCECVD